MTERKILIVVEGRDNASGALRGVGGALGNIGQIAGGILTAGIFQNIGSGLMDMGRQALDAVGDYERLGMTLQTLAAREFLNTGQATEMSQALEMAGSKGKELLHWVEQLAIKSPFTSTGVADAFRTAMAYGFTADEAKRLSEAMINFAAGSGASEQVMSTIALALGQIQAKGKLAGQEVLQLVNAGLPVTQILAKAFNKTTAEIQDMQSKGLISAKDAIEAIVTTLERDFAGAAERQSVSWAGLQGTFEDLKEIGLREFFGGIAEAIQPMVLAFADWLQGDGMVKIREWGESLGNLTKFVVGLAEAFMDTGDIFSSEFMESLTAFLPQEAQDKFFALMQGVQQIFAGFQPVLDSFGAFWIINGPAIMQVVQNVFGRLAELGMQLAQSVLPWLAEKMEYIGGWFNANAPLIQAFANNVGIAITWLAEQFVGLWNVVAPLLSGIIDIVLGLVKTIMQLATGDWAGAWDSIIQILQTAVSAIFSALVALIEWILGLFGISLPEIQRWWSETWENIKTKIADAWNQIVTNTKNAVADFIAAVKEVFNNAVQAAQEFISDFVDMGRNLIDGIVRGITSAAGNVVGALRDVVNNAVAAAQNALGIHSPSRIFAAIGQNMMEGLAQGVGAGLSVPVNAVTGAVDSITTGAAMAGGAGVAGSGALGGAMIQFVYSPAFSMADEHEFKNQIAPAIEKLLRERGLI